MRLSIHLDGSPTWLPGARHIWMCALFGLPSALDPDPSSWRVVERVDVGGVAWSVRTEEA